MKYLAALLILVLPSISLAQIVNNSLQANDTLKFNEILSDLLSTWNIGLNEDGDELAEITDFNKFKSLFNTDATIFNDIDAYYNPKGNNDTIPYKIKNENATVENYAHDLALHFKNMKIDTSAVDILTDSINNGIYKVRITKTISGEKKRDYIFEDIDAYADRLIKTNREIYKITIDDTNKDSIVNRLNKFIKNGTATYTFKSNYKLMIRMQKKDSVTYKILSIVNESNDFNVRCTNDNDHDGVTDSEDCKSSKGGEITGYGCSDIDLDGVIDTFDNCKTTYGRIENEGCPLNYFATRFELSGTVGLQMNSVNQGMPELDQLGYNSVDYNESKQGSLNNPNLIFSPFIAADIAFYFNKSKRLGISLGAAYTNFKATYEVSDAAVYTFKSNDGVNDYRRQITLLDGSQEEITYSILNFPLMLNYRYRAAELTDDKTIPNWYIEFGIGPSFMMFNNTSKYNSNISFEGLYQVDTVNKDGIAYYDYFDNGSTWNIFVTGDSIDQQSGTPGSDVVFGLMNNNGYDFSTGNNYSGTSKGLNKSAIAINLKFDACYKFTDNGKVAFKFGANATIAPLPSKSNDYQLIDKTTDPYNSIYNSNSKSTYFAFGLHAGFIFQF